MRRKIKFKLVVTGLLLALLIIPKQALAVFSLSVTPYEGGYDLRYTKLGPGSGRMNIEVKVNISTDIGKKYLFTQTFVEPLSTMEGARITQGNFVLYGIRGTNQYGTLNVEQEVPVALGRQILYTSNANGTADSFTLVYGLSYSPDIEPGSYRGRLSFNLEALDSNESPVTVILNVSLEVEAAAVIEVKTLSGTEEILLKPDIEETEAASVGINIRGGFGRQFRILQVVGEQPVSKEGVFLNWDTVSYSGTNAQKGMVINTAMPLSPQPQIIYTSSTRGEQDNLVINYSLGDLSKQEAGVYRTKIRYILEGIGFAASRLITVLGLEIDIPRLFDLIVTPELGGTIRFYGLKPLEPPKTQEVTLEIKSNIGRQYQVTQNMSGLLTTKDGYSIAKEFFSLREEGPETKGSLKFPQKTPVNEGQMVLFISDSLGSADKFKLIYELTAPRDVHSGDYTTNFNYSISEI